MKFKLIALVLLAAGVIAAGLIRTASTTHKKSLPYKDRLKWYAKEAKSEGRQKVRIPADLIEYLGGAGTISAEEAFSSFSVVIAHLVSKESYPRSEDIVTWNKFAIDEVLSEAKQIPCTTCGASDPPSNLMPLQKGEFLMSKAGGSVALDGVEIEQIEESFPQFETNQQYLLLITLNPAGTAWTMGGPVGVFKVDKHERLEPVRPSDHRVHKDFKEKYGNSLEQLSYYLNKSS